MDAEDLADIAAADAAKAALARGEEELLPDWFVDRILSGDNPVRVWREYRGLTREQVSASSGVPAPDVAAIEDGGAKAEPGAVAKIVAALGVDPDDLT